MQQRGREKSLQSCSKKGGLSLKSQVYFCPCIEVLSGAGGGVKGRDQPQLPFVKE